MGADMMGEQQLVVRFVTPAFLGDAEQKGAWRTPPFKALLRQWWRVAAAPRCGYDHIRLREDEGRLFGHAWLKDNGKAWSLGSRLHLRLDGWRPGQLERWPPDPQVQHPEVGEGGRAVGSHLYLGYGPLVFEKGAGTKLKVAPAIAADEQATLALAYPERLRGEFSAMFQLIAWFGTVGGRSRNGWGSLELTGDGVKGLDHLRRDDPLLSRVSRPLEDCLRLDWPHALGSDSRGLLVWRTKGSEKSWGDTMKTLAEVKIAYRTSFPFDNNRDAGNPVFESRHLLAYPVTNHGVVDWSDREEKTGNPRLTKRGTLRQTDRLANQLRFKVLHGSSGYVGIIAHLPCGLPDLLGSRLQPRPSVDHQLEVWRKVHSILDARSDLQRV